MTRSSRVGSGCGRALPGAQARDSEPGALPTVQEGVMLRMAGFKLAPNLNSRQGRLGGWRAAQGRNLNAGHGFWVEAC